MRGNIAAGVFNVKTLFTAYKDSNLANYPAMNRLSPSETNALRCLLFASFIFNTCVLLNRLQLPLGTQDVYKRKTPLGFEPINRNVHTLKEAVGMIVPTDCCRCLWFCDKVLILIRFR